MMEAVRNSDTSVNFCGTTEPYRFNPEDRRLYGDTTSKGDVLLVLA
jgi:hypothetical protein